MLLHRYKLLLLLSILLLLTGCGGGGGGGGGSASIPVTPVYTIDQLTDGVSGSFSTIAHSADYSVASGGPVSWNLNQNNSDTTVVTIKAGAGTSYNDGVSSISLTDTNTGASISLVDSNSGDSIDFSAPDTKRITAYNSNDRINHHRRSTQSWDYQSFGFWNTYGDITTSLINGSAGNFSFGSATHPSLIPATGTATYTGEQFGVKTWADGAITYAREVESDFTANANFADRSIAVSTSNSRINPHDSNEYASTAVNFSGDLTYSSSANLFSGTVTTNEGWSGTATGRFYGPNAEELGGVAQIKGSGSVDILASGFGAKR